MARIAWVEDDAATGPLADFYAQFHAAGRAVPDIFRVMSLRPDFLFAVQSASKLHFTEGALTVAQHEMIASYVAALNRCHY